MFLRDLQGMLLLQVCDSANYIWLLLGGFPFVYHLNVDTLILATHILRDLQPYVDIGSASWCYRSLLSLVCELIVLLV